MRLLATLCLVAVLASCSGGSPAAVRTTTEPTPTVTETTPSPTPSAAPTTTAPTPTPTLATRRRPAVDGDVDGDGKADTIRASATKLTVELSGSGRIITALVHSDEPGAPTLLGSKDVDRDGYAEVFLETAQGASTTFATPYRFDGTALHELQLDGGPVRLGIGGSVTHGDGFACLPTGRLEVRSAESSDGVSFTVHTDLYRLGTSQLLLVSSATSHAKQGDPTVEQSYQVRCGSVGDGG